MGIATNALKKQPAETRLFLMDYSGAMSKGETIVSLDSSLASPSGPTFGTTTIDGQKAGTLVSGGINRNLSNLQLILKTGPLLSKQKSINYKNKRKCPTRKRNCSAWLCCSLKIEE